jgi:chemotaxis family two-component system response regulator Rcp1
MMTETEDRPIYILSVEDNLADMRLISEILSMSKLNTRLEFVRDGGEALDLLHSCNKVPDQTLPDLILLDLTLPRVDGHEVLKSIKSDPKLKRIPVLVLSGSRKKEDIDRSYELHANTYIVKPFDLDELTAVMRGIEDYWLKIAQLPGAESDTDPGMRLRLLRRARHPDGDPPPFVPE